MVGGEWASQCVIIKSDFRMLRRGKIVSESKVSMHLLLLLSVECVVPLLGFGGRKVCSSLSGSRIRNSGIPGIPNSERSEVVTLKYNRGIK